MNARVAQIIVAPPMRALSSVMEAAAQVSRLISSMWVTHAKAKQTIVETRTSVRYNVMVAVAPLGRILRSVNVVTLHRIYEIVARCLIHAETRIYESFYAMVLVVPVYHDNREI